jgi:hypothetical protein
MEPDVVANRTANECDQQLPGSQAEDHPVWHPQMSWNFLSLHDDLLFLLIPTCGQSNNLSPMASGFGSQNQIASLIASWYYMCSKKALIDRVLLR